MKRFLSLSTTIALTLSTMLFTGCQDTKTDSLADLPDAAQTGQLTRSGGSGSLSHLKIYGHEVGFSSDTFTYSIIDPNYRTNIETALPNGVEWNVNGLEIINSTKYSVTVVLPNLTYVSYPLPCTIYANYIDPSNGMTASLEQKPVLTYSSIGLQENKIAITKQLGHENPEGYNTSYIGHRLTGQYALDYYTDGITFNYAYRDFMSSETPIFRSWFIMREWIPSQIMYGNPGECDFLEDPVVVSFLPSQRPSYRYKFVHLNYFEGDEAHWGECDAIFQDDGFCMCPTNWMVWQGPYVQYYDYDSQGNPFIPEDEHEAYLHQVLDATLEATIHVAEFYFEPEDREIMVERMKYATEDNPVPLFRLTPTMYGSYDYEEAYQFSWTIPYQDRFYTNLYIRGGDRYGNLDIYN